MSRTIEIIIGLDGSSRIESKGFAGRSCLDSTRFLEEALGVKSKDERTPEFYRPVEQEESLRQQNQT